MDTETLVYVDLAGAAHLVGRLWARARKNKEGATFEYDREWLQHPARFSLEPALTLGPGPFHTGDRAAMFGAFGDSAPDRWGRTLMRRMERRRADHEGQTPRALREIDYLLLVDDEARQGALRFAQQPDGPFLREGGARRIPPLIDLPQLLSAAEHFVADKDTDEELKFLFAPGSSLGGARPKASVIDKDGHLTIAKFPRRDDEYNTVAWEAVALSLAQRAGIEVPSARIETVDGKQVLLSKRFDREGAHRVPFLSAMSMLGAKDNETRSYMELVDALRQHGASARQGMEALWRRLVFIILISNTDDHLRNHGFLYAGTSGWRLSPAYDLNPVPADIKPRILTTAINEDDTTASLQVALDTANYFGLTTKNARAIAAEVGAAVARWRNEAKSFGLTNSQTDRMASAFEHEDLALALRG